MTFLGGGEVVWSQCSVPKICYFDEFGYPFSVCCSARPHPFSFSFLGNMGPHRFWAPFGFPSGWNPFWGFWWWPLWVRIYSFIILGKSGLCVTKFCNWNILFRISEAITSKQVNGIPNLFRMMIFCFRYHVHLQYLADLSKLCFVFLHIILRKVWL